jgi:hypothetical protein
LLHPQILSLEAVPFKGGRSELARVYLKYLKYLMRYRPSLLFARNGIVALPVKWLLGRTG